MVDASLDARRTIATLMGTVTFRFACPQVARMLAGGDLYAPKVLAVRREHVIEIARRILEVR